MKKITDNCTGCSACVKKCPKNAISMKKKELFDIAIIDEDKCINCDLCRRVCPSNRKERKNSPVIKVARLDDEVLIMKSASGGIFASLASYILLNDGVVYGAAYSEDFKSVNHIRCDDLNDLDLLKKSKYVRSNINNCFELAEDDLKNGKKVLFSGTPCQIAGLKCYLKKEYDNLYTVDIVCHGTPSPIVWKKYAEWLEKREKSKITKVDFRHFNRKDPSKNFLVEFENGTVLNEVLYDTSYGRAFLIGLINDDCCDNCKFNNFRNFSDITLGDAWGYSNQRYPNKNSLIFLNNEKGINLFNYIKEQLIEFDDFNFREMINSGYPIIHSTFKHYNSGKINLNAKDIDKELWYWLDDKNGLVKDKNGVGILNFHYENYNYGANLVAYSLSEVIKRLGFNPYIIDFDPFPDFGSIDRYRTLGLYEFRKKHLNMTPRFRNKDELSILNDYLDMYVVGSDQVWRKAITQSNVETYFLDFVQNKNKISYAASFGKDYFEGNGREKIACIKHLSSFYGVSVRENDAVDVCKNTFDCKAEVMLDPTLLLTKDDYEKIIDDCYSEKHDVAVYFVMDYENKILEDENFKRLFPNKKIVNIKGEVKSYPYGDVFVFNSVSKWLDGFRKAEYIVTDSYHGVIFGIIFNKKIICIGKNSAALSRFNTLFENLKGNLDKINYASLSDVKSIKDFLNYDEINSNIKNLREKSISFLKDNLGSDKVKEPYKFFKGLDEAVLDICNENEELKTKIEGLNRKLDEYKFEYDSIINSRSWKITKPIRVIKRRLRGRDE